MVEDIFLTNVSDTIVYCRQHGGKYTSIWEEAYRWLNLYATHAWTQIK